MSLQPFQPQNELPIRTSQESSCQNIIDEIGLRLGIENPSIKVISPEFGSYSELGPRQQFFRDNLLEYFARGKGKSLSVLEGRNVLAPTPKVGWGHLVQISGEAHDMANILGMNVFLMDPVDLLNDKEKITV